MKKKIKLDDIDVVFDPTPLTEEEKKLISEFIKQDKANRLIKSKRPNSPKRIGTHAL
jgi:hypothetical protein